MISSEWTENGKKKKKKMKVILIAGAILVMTAEFRMNLARC